MSTITKANVTLTQATDGGQLVDQDGQTYDWPIKIGYGTTVNLGSNITLTALNQQFYFTNVTDKNNGSQSGLTNLTEGASALHKNGDYDHLYFPINEIGGIFDGKGKVVYLKYSSAFQRFGGLFRPGALLNNVTIKNVGVELHESSTNFNGLMDDCGYIVSGHFGVFSIGVTIQHCYSKLMIKGNRVAGIAGAHFGFYYNEAQVGSSNISFPWQYTNNLWIRTNKIVHCLTTGKIVNGDDTGNSGAGGIFGNYGSGQGSSFGTPEQTRYSLGLWPNANSDNILGTDNSSHKKTHQAYICISNCVVTGDIEKALAGQNRDYAGGIIGFVKEHPTHTEGWFRPSKVRITNCYVMSAFNNYTVNDHGTNISATRYNTSISKGILSWQGVQSDFGSGFSMYGYGLGIGYLRIAEYANWVIENVVCPFPSILVNQGLTSTILKSSNIIQSVTNTSDYPSGNEHNSTSLTPGVWDNANVAPSNLEVTSISTNENQTLDIGPSKWYDPEPTDTSTPWSLDISPPELSFTSNTYNHDSSSSGTIDLLSEMTINDETTAAADCTIELSKIVKMDGVTPIATVSDIPLSVVGAYNVEYNTSDTLSNSGVFTRVVNVVQPPLTVNLLGDEGSLYTTQASKTDTFVDPGAVVGTGTADTFTTLNADLVLLNALGTYTITYTASNSTESDTKYRTVIVDDTLPPVLTMKYPDQNLTTIYPTKGTYSDPGYYIEDNYNNNADITVTGSTPDLRNVGTYTISYVATDTSGNTSETSYRTVVVEDNIVPKITHNIGGTNLETSFTINLEYDSNGVANLNTLNLNVVDNGHTFAWNTTDNETGDFSIDFEQSETYLYYRLSVTHIINRDGEEVSITDLSDLGGELQNGYKYGLQSTSTPNLDHQSTTNYKGRFAVIRGLQLFEKSDTMVTKHIGANDNNIFYSSIPEISYYSLTPEVTNMFIDSTVNSGTNNNSILYPFNVIYGNTKWDRGGTALNYGYSGVQGGGAFLTFDNRDEANKLKWIYNVNLPEQTYNMWWYKAQAIGQANEQQIPPTNTYAAGVKTNNSSYGKYDSYIAGLTTTDIKIDANTNNIYFESDPGDDQLGEDLHHLGYEGLNYTLKETACAVLFKPDFSKQNTIIGSYNYDLSDVQDYEPNIVIKSQRNEYNYNGGALTENFGVEKPSGVTHYRFSSYKGYIPSRWKLEGSNSPPTGDNVIWYFFRTDRGPGNNINYYQTSNSRWYLEGNNYSSIDDWELTINSHYTTNNINYFRTPIYKTTSAIQSKWTMLDDRTKSCQIPRLTTDSGNEVITHSTDLASDNSADAVSQRNAWIDKYGPGEINRLNINSFSDVPGANDAERHAFLEARARFVLPRYNESKVFPDFAPDGVNRSDRLNNAFNYNFNNMLEVPTVDPSAFPLNELTSMNAVFRYTDISGKSTSLNAVINVVDNTPPVINIPLVDSSPTHTIQRDGNPATQEYTNMTGITVVDNYDGTITESLSIDADYSNVVKSVVGTYSVLYRATDTNGNAGSKYRTVVVSDSTAPFVHLDNTSYSSDTYTTTYEAALSDLNIKTRVYFTDDSETHTDYDLTIESNGNTYSQVPLSLIGTYTVTHSYTDGFNASTLVGTVIVEDTTGPDITFSDVNTSADTQSITIQRRGGVDAPVGYSTISDISVVDLIDGDVKQNLTIVSDTVVRSVVGTYTIEYQASDSQNNTTTSYRTVIVNDLTRPEFIYDGVTMTNGQTYYKTIEASLDDYNVTTDVSVVDDNDELQDYNTSVTKDGYSDNTNVTASVLGEYTIVHTYSDGTNSATLNGIITVEDTTGPEISFNPERHTIQVNLSADSQEYTNMTGITAVDIVDGDVSANISLDSSNNNVVPSVAGQYSVLYTASDSQGNTSSKYRVVIVADDTVPSFVYDGVTQTNGQTYYKTIEYSIGDYLVTDLVSVSDNNVTGLMNYNTSIVNGSYTSSTVVPYSVTGSYTIEHTYTDGFNQTTLNGIITVEDTQKPVIQLSGDVGSKYTIDYQSSTYSDPGATATDPISGAVSVTTTGTVNVNVLGTYTLSYSAQDTNGNVANTVYRTVIVADNEPPVVTLKKQVRSLPLRPFDTYSDLAAIVTDNYDESIDIISDPSVVKLSVLGTYTISYHAVDSNGNVSDTVYRTVVVYDDSEPVILYQGSPNTFTLVAEYSNTNTVNLTQDITVTDNEQTMNWDKSNSQFSISVSPANHTDVTLPYNNLGIHTVTYTYTDAAQNVGTLIGYYDIRDTTGPVFTFNNDSQTKTIQRKGGVDAPVGYTIISDISVVDERQGDVKDSLTIVSDTVIRSVVGTYTVEYKASDSLNNVTTSYRTVIVADTTVPQFIYNGVTRENNHTYNKTIEYTLGDYNVTTDVSVVDDNDQIQDYNTSVTKDGYSDNTNVTASVLGEYTIVHTYSDGTNSATLNGLITVADRTPPVITAIPETIAKTVSDDKQTYTNKNGVEAVDYYDGTINDNLTIMNEEVVVQSVVGTYTVRYEATDSSGNTGTGYRTVVVSDTSVPVVLYNGSSDSFTHVREYSNTNTVNLTQDITVTDNDESLNWNTSNSQFSISVSPANNSDITLPLNNLGVHTITYTYTDESQNVGTLIGYYDIRDTTGPVITFHDGNYDTQSIQRQRRGGVDAPIGYSTISDISVIDERQGDIKGSLTIVSDTVIRSVVGTYTVEYKASDSLNNTTTSYRTVEVVDGTRPQFIYESVTRENNYTYNKTIEYTLGDYNVTTDVYAIDDNDEIQDYNTSVTKDGYSDNTNVTASVLGEYTIVHTYSDGFNSATLNGLITVADRTPPVITAIPETIAKTVSGDKQTYTNMNGVEAVDYRDGTINDNLIIMNEEVVVQSVVGTYTVRYEATDSSGNTGTGYRTVVVSDTSIPVFNYNGVGMSNGATYNKTLEYSIGDYTVTDLVNVSDNDASGITNYVTTINDNSTSTVPYSVVGEYTITHTYSDGYNSATLNGIIVVEDNFKPEMSLSGSNGEIYTIEYHKTDTYVEDGAVASDRIDGNLTVDIAGDEVKRTLLGSYVVKYTATDNNNNSSTLFRTVVVEDSTPPVITATVDTIDKTVSDQKQTYTNKEGVQAIDYHDGEINNSLIIMNEEVVEQSVVGTYTVRYEATDSSGNTGTGYRTVVVRDVSRPVFNYNGQAMNNGATYNKTLEYSIGDYTVTDLVNVSDNDASGITNYVTTINDNSTSVVPYSVVGEYTITHTYSDGYNSATLNGIIVVEDTHPLVMTMAGEQWYTLDYSTNAYQDPGVTATDKNYPGQLNVTTIGNNVDLTAVGNSYTITYTAENNQQSDTLYRTVVVEDLTPPDISLIGDEVVENHGAFTEFVDQGVNVSDIYDTAINYTTSITTISGDLDFINPIQGDYEIKYYAEDSRGNVSDTLTRTVKVVESANVPPVININTNVVEKSYAWNSSTDIVAEVNPRMTWDGASLDPSLYVYRNEWVSYEANTEFRYWKLTVYTSDGDTFVDGVEINNFTIKYGSENTIDDNSYSLTKESPSVPVLNIGSSSRQVSGYTFEVGATNKPTRWRLFGTNDNTYTQWYLIHDMYTQFSNQPSTSSGKSNSDHHVTIMSPTVINGNSYSNDDLLTFNEPTEQNGRLLERDSTYNIYKISNAYFASYKIRFNYLSPGGTSATEKVVKIFITDGVAPEIQLTNPDVITTQSFSLDFVFNDPGYGATDDLDVNVNVIRYMDGINPDDIRPGLYTIRYEASDSNNTTTAYRTVRFDDSIAPVIELNNPEILIETIGYSAEPYSDYGATATKDPWEVSISLGTINEVNPASIGTYIITYMAEDAVGNKADNKYRTIIVEDQVPPVLDLVQEGIVHTIDYSFTTSYEDMELGWSANDYLGTVAKTIDSIDISYDTVSSSVIGTYTVTYVATDENQNTTTKFRTVVVEDNLPPVVHLNDPEITIETLEYAISDYAERGAYGLDEYDGSITAVVSGDTVDMHSVGTYVIKYDSVDLSNNNATPAYRTVVIKDTQKPVITLEDNATLHITLTASETYSDPGVVATDPVDGVNGVSVQTIDSHVLLNTLGTYTVTYIATDNNLQSETAFRTIVVFDDEAPVITVNDPFNNVVSLSSNPADVYNDPGFTATDIEGFDIVYQTIGNVTLTQTGFYTIKYLATDTANNTATAFRTVEVRDYSLPVIDLVPPVIHTVEYSPTEEYTDPGSSCTDTQDGQLTINIGYVNGVTVDRKTKGSYTITYNTSDSDGNVAEEKYRTVVVVDSTPPVITLSGDQLHTVEYNLNGEYTDPGYSAEDLHDGVVSVDVDYSSLQMSVLGTYTIVYNSQDNNVPPNHATPVTRTVVVEDTTPPVIQLTPPQFYTINYNTEYTEHGISATDELEGSVSVNVDMGGFSKTPEDVPQTYVITYTANDSSNNQADTVYRTVVVDDLLPPQIALIGESRQVFKYLGTFTDQGAIVTDNRDQTTTISGDSSSVDMNVIGEYTVTYTASDRRGRSAEPVYRTISVEPTMIEGNKIVTQVTEDGPYKGQLKDELDNYYDWPIGVKDKVTLNSDITIDSNEQFFIFFNNNATISGSNVGTKITFDNNLRGYKGFVKNMGYSNVKVRKLFISQLDESTSRPTDLAPHLDTNAGYYLQEDFTVGSSGNSIEECFIEGNIKSGAAALVGKNSQNVTVKNCYVLENTASRHTNSNIFIGVSTNNNTNTISYSFYYNYNTSYGLPTVLDNTGASNHNNNYITNEWNDTEAAILEVANNNIWSDIDGTSTPAKHWVLTWDNRADKESPVILLNGDDTVFVAENSVYNDQGATATDNITENVSLDTEDNVNTSIIGTYSVTYVATDNAMNTATSFRTVVVTDRTSAEARASGLTQDDIDNLVQSASGESTITINVNLVETVPTQQEEFLNIDTTQSSQALNSIANTVGTQIVDRLNTITTQIEIVNNLLTASDTSVNDMINSRDTINSGTFTVDNIDTDDDRIQSISNNVISNASDIIDIDILSIGADSTLDENSEIDTQISNRLNTNIANLRSRRSQVLTIIDSMQDDSYKNAGSQMLAVIDSQIQIAEDKKEIIDSHTRIAPLMVKAANEAVANQIIQSIDEDLSVTQIQTIIDIVDSQRTTSNTNDSSKKIRQTLIANTGQNEETGIANASKEAFISNNSFNFDNLLTTISQSLPQVNINLTSTEIENIVTNIPEDNVSGAAKFAIDNEKAKDNSKALHATCNVLLRSRIDATGSVDARIVVKTEGENSSNIFTNNRVEGLFDKENVVIIPPGTSQFSIPDEITEETRWYSPLEIGQSRTINKIRRGDPFTILRNSDDHYIIQPVVTNGIIGEMFVEDFLPANPNLRDENRLTYNVQTNEGYFLLGDSVTVNGEPLVFGGVGGNGSSIAGAGGDPYVTTIDGELYKLDNISGYCRMLQGTLNGKNIIVNVEMIQDTQDIEEEMNNWLDSVDKNLKYGTKQYLQSFFTKVYIKYGDSEFIMDIPNFNIIRHNGSEIKSRDITRMHTVLPMYNDTSVKETRRDDGMLQDDVIEVKCDNLSVCISRSSNKQIRSEVLITGGENVKNKYGFVVQPMSTKYCKVKKLNSTKQLEKKKQPQYKRQIKERFNLIDQRYNKSSTENVYHINSF